MIVGFVIQILHTEAVLTSRAEARRREAWTGASSLFTSLVSISDPN
jgi:hypothetical protein